MRDLYSKQAKKYLLSQDEKTCACIPVADINDELTDEEQRMLAEARNGDYEPL